MENNNLKEKWATVQIAAQYYGMSVKTLHTWRKNKRIKSRPAPQGIGYEYLLDEELKAEIDVLKKFDRRWS